MTNLPKAPSPLRRRDAQTIAEAIDNAEILSPEPEPLDAKLSRYPLTDLGNAERFEKRNKDKLLFCDVQGWLRWDERRFTRRGAEAALRVAEHDTVRAIQEEAAWLQENGFSDDASKLKKWGRTSEAVGRLKAISERAASMMCISIDEFDSDPMMLTVNNGTLHFKKTHRGEHVRLLPHSPSDRITRLAPVTYDPTAKCPRYDEFMNEVQPDTNVQLFLDQCAAVALTGLTGDQKFTFHYGRGRNGKSVYVGTISHMLGDYAATIRIENLQDAGRQSSGAQATPDIARLRGVRFLSTSEPGKGERLAESLVKLLTGEDTISARSLFKEPIEFRPQLKLAMQGNYRPHIRGTDDGIWGRVILVRWKQFIPKEKRDANLSQKLQTEASGILNRYLRALREYLEFGLIIPDIVTQETEEYRDESDPLGRFLQTCTADDPAGRVRASEMHHIFLAWAKANGETLWTGKGLGSALRDKGYVSQKSSNIYWLGLKLTVTASELGDGEQGDVSRRGVDEHESY